MRTTNLRLPDDTADRLREMATWHRRSQNAEIITLIDRAYDALVEAELQKVKDREAQ